MLPPRRGKRQAESAADAFWRVNKARKKRLIKFPQAKHAAV